MELGYIMRAIAWKNAFLVFFCLAAFATLVKYPVGSPPLPPHARAR